MADCKLGESWVQDILVITLNWVWRFGGEVVFKMQS
jgi:hypothetical protein